ncbi:hypothetical protein JCM6292_983 [Bacteroides pyogenes JCM 6292]|uniref:Uncharacterized protein n=1 Tax=Bacteroides pyogenes JCM 6292 TaxID=1235809 RepID=W4P4R9_9BACE|nr:hypothetical protein JCM6292_983 [Bacteroides pyogenes JCM 6292]
MGNFCFNSGKLSETLFLCPGSMHVRFPYPSSPYFPFTPACLCAANTQSAISVFPITLPVPAGHHK